MSKGKIRTWFGMLALIAAPLLVGLTASAQSVSTSIDRRSILIGEHINYELRFTLPSAQYQVEFNVPDSIPHFDVINKQKSDSTDDKGNYLVYQKILFTSFDSGKWNFPSFAVKLRSSNSAAVYTLNTDAISIDVGYSPADSSGQLRDIKPVMDVFVIDDDWLIIGMAIITALLIIYLLYRWLKKRKKEKPLYDSTLSPYEEAMKALTKLEAAEVSGPDDTKEFHTRVADIFRRYYSRKEQKPFMNKTTGDILLHLKSQGAGTALVFAIAEVLRVADAVKFARYLTTGSENKASLDQLRAAIGDLDRLQTK